MGSNLLSCCCSLYLMSPIRVHCQVQGHENLPLYFFEFWGFSSTVWATRLLLSLFLYVMWSHGVSFTLGSRWEEQPPSGTCHSSDVSCDVFTWYVTGSWLKAVFRDLEALGGVAQLGELVHWDVSSEAVSCPRTLPLCPAHCELFNSLCFSLQDRQELLK